MMRHNCTFFTPGCCTKILSKLEVFQGINYQVPKSPGLVTFVLFWHVCLV